MAQSSLSTVAAFMKRYYPDDATGDIASRGTSLLKWMPKRTNMFGYDASGTYAYAVGLSNAQGMGSTVANAQSNVTASKAIQFKAERKKHYGLITLDGETMQASRNAKGAFWEARKREIDMILDGVGEEEEFGLFGDGTGNRGQISAISTGVINLTVPGTVRNFRLNMKLSADTAAAATGTRRAGTGWVIATDEDAGTITVSATQGGAAGTPTAWAANDYLFRNTYEGTAAGTNVEGLAAILPLAAPSASESFRGVDRSIDPRRLAGVRINDTSTSIEENAGNAAVKISELGVPKADDLVLFLSPTNLWNVLKRRTSQVVYQGGGGEMRYGFNSGFIETPAGVIAMKASPLCPDNRGYLLNKSTWFLASLSPVPHIIDDDGNMELRSTTDDGVEIRVRSMRNPVCLEPGKNAVFAI